LNKTDKDLPVLEKEDALNAFSAGRTFSGGGEMGERIRSFDWSRTPLGPIESWSPALRTTTSILLANRFPMLLWWGPQFIQIYNDPYRPVLGTKHPNPGLGRPLSECWSEIWDILRPLVETPFNGGPSTWMEDIFLEVNRHGFTEETHFTVAYSPVPDETVPSGIGGVLATVHEITEKVINERRIALLQNLGARSAEARTAEEACEDAAATLRDAKDITFALFYLLDPDRKNAHLAAASGIAQGTETSPINIPLDIGRDSPWQVMKALETEQIHVVENLSEKFANIPQGPWSEPARAAAVIPIRSHIQRQPAGFIIAGLSPRQSYGKNYASFLDLISTQVATAVANARAYEEERKRAEVLAELDRAKTTFFSNVSHELRTPLTLMLGPIEDELREHPESRARLELVQRNSLRLLKLVNTLLDFARIEAGRVQANFEPTDLALYTADLASGFRSAMEHAGLQFIVDCPPLPESIFIDREMWEKVVLNLLSNAFKFTLNGSVTVNLRFRGDSAELTVSDTGTGIPAAELPRIFERFHRARSGQARTHEGTGIGLALVQELVRLLGGEIRVTSVEGKGTVFTVNLPAGSRHLPKNFAPAGRKLESTAVGSAPFLQEAMSWVSKSSEPSPESDLTRNKDFKPSKHPVRILVAEDNADMRQYIVRLLNEHYTVTAVADGQSALEAIRAERPDLVLSDIMMPRLDGFELLDELRSQPDTSTLPVILLSARAGEEARLEGVSRQANDYLVKPFSSRELFARVSTHLELARVRQEAETTLRERENRFHAWIQASANIMYCMSADWTEMRLLVGKDFVIDTNDANLSWLEKYIYPEDQKFVIAAVQEAIVKKTAFQLEHRVIQKDGSMGWVFSRAIPLLDTHGEIIEWFGAATDITGRKESERKFAELFEREKEARQEAEAATRMKDHFLAKLSHELRTPLNPVLLIASDSAENPELPADIREQFQTILKNVEVEARLIDDLLDLSRINHGKLKLNMRSVDAHAVLHETMQVIQDQMVEKQIQTVLDLKAAQHTVSADAVRLQQVFWNVLKNAVKFTPRAGKIRVETYSAHGQGLDVRITDTGIGMTPLELEQVFAPFTQGEHTMDKFANFGGLGLGLAISRRLVEMHSGSIQAESEGRGHGSCFTIKIPLAKG
jgi:signal transduction histidine kinase